MNREQKGFAVGVLVGLASRFGIITISSDIAFLIFVIGTMIPVVHKIQNKPLFTHFADAFASGFCWTYGFLNLFHV